MSLDGYLAFAETLADEAAKRTEFLAEWQAAVAAAR